MDKNDKIQERVKIYHQLSLHSKNQKTILQKVLGKVSFHLLNTLQLLLGIDRRKKRPFELSYGSNWVSLTPDLVKKLLENQEWIEERFQKTLCADEHFLHSFILNFDLLSTVYSSQENSEDLQGHMRYINWELGMPYTFQSEQRDYDLLRQARQSGHLFARKFDLEAYPDMKDFILDLHQKN